MTSPNKKAVYRQRRLLALLVIVCVIAVGVAIALAATSIHNKRNDEGDPGTTEEHIIPVGTDGVIPIAPSGDPGSTGTALESEAPTEAPTAEPTAAPVSFKEVSAHSSATVSIHGFYTELMVSGYLANSYNAPERISFDHNDDYCKVEGITTFRGSCFRQDPFYGTANVSEGRLQISWNKETFSVGKGEGGKYTGVWTGSGWTGQALVVRWDAETKAIMNMYDSAKAKDGLIEVIYATMDGNIYFYDMETGEATRNKIVMGVPFKGSGSIDPRGYPVLYVGQGDHYSAEGKASKAYAISLIDGHVLAKFGEKPDSFALRTWHAYDSAPIVDGASDTLFYPGENGILSRVKLNTKFDKAAGTLTMNPDSAVKLRYHTNCTDNGGYWLGYESSAVAWRHYIYVCDNAGYMQCIDVNTMKVVWVQDIWDDTNATPCLEEDPENGTAYLYVGNTLDNKADGNGYGKVAFFKIDACTGQIVWKAESNIYTTHNITGGYQSSAILGRGELDGLVITALCSYGNGNSGTVIAYDKNTGEQVWTYKLNGYTWSSPVALYDANGKAYIIQCNSTGNIYVLDGQGNQLDVINVESNIESSPVAFDNYIVIGTRVKGIFGIRIF